MCLKAALNSWFMREGSFETIIGVEAEFVEHLVAVYPEINDDDGPEGKKAWTAINNSMNFFCAEYKEWKKTPDAFPKPPTEILRVFYKWRAIRGFEGDPAYVARVERKWQKMLSDG